MCTACERVYKKRKKYKLCVYLGEECNDVV